MAVERQNPADPATLKDLERLYEDPKSAEGFLSGIRRGIQSVRDGVREKPVLTGVLTFIAALGAAGKADARYPEFEEGITPIPFSELVNPTSDDPQNPNFLPSEGVGDPRISWALQSRDTGLWHIQSLGLRPMPGATIEEVPPVTRDTLEADSIQGFVPIPNDGTLFKMSSLDGIIMRKRPGEPEFTQFIGGGDCMRPGRPGFLNIGYRGRLYEMPIDYNGPLVDPRDTIALRAPSNRPGIYETCAAEIPLMDGGIVILDDSMGIRPLAYFERRPDGSLEGPFDLPWGDGISPTIYVNGTGIWIAYTCLLSDPPRYGICRAVLPHPDRDRDGVRNADDNCSDDYNPAQLDAACRRPVEELRAIGFERRVEPGTLLAGETDVIPHPSPPPDIENPQRGVFRGIGGIRATEAHGGLVDIVADLPTPPPGFTFGSIQVEVNVRDGEIIFLGDPPRSFTPADGSQIIEVPAGFQAVIQGTDAEMWVRGWTYVPIPDRDAGVGDAGAEGGADAGAEAGADGGDGGMGGDIPDAGPREGGAGDAGDSPDAGGRDGGMNADVPDAGEEDVQKDTPSDIIGVGDITPDRQELRDGMIDVFYGDHAQNEDSGNNHDAGVESDETPHPHPPGGCGACSIIRAHDETDLKQNALPIAAAMASILAFAGRVLGRRKRETK